MAVVIGITGGAGAGKSALLSYIGECCGRRCRIIRADDLANDIKRKGRPGYEPVVELLGTDVLDSDGEIDKGRMAKLLFSDSSLREQINRLLHPLVNAYIAGAIDMIRYEGPQDEEGPDKENRQGCDILFIEAALLIENGYREIVDELWYIYASEETRRERLMRTRGYDSARVDGIFSGQLTDAEFRAAADLVIDNDGSKERAFEQIRVALQDRGLMRNAEC